MKALLIRKQTDEKKRRSYVFRSQGEYVKAEDSARKSLEMSEDIGDRKGTASFSRVLETVYLSCVEYVKATESYEKSLSVMKETHLTDRGFEASHTRA